MPHIRGHRNGGAGGPNRDQNNRNGRPTRGSRRSPQGNRSPNGGRGVRQSAPRSSPQYRRDMAPPPPAPEGMDHEQWRMMWARMTGLFW